MLNNVQGSMNTNNQPGRYREFIFMNQIGIDSHQPCTKTLLSELLIVKTYIYVYFCRELGVKKFPLSSYAIQLEGNQHL